MAKNKGDIKIGETTFELGGMEFKVVGGFNGADGKPKRITAMSVPHLEAMDKQNGAASNVEALSGDATQ